MDLFELKVSKKKLHKNFISISNNEDVYARELLNSWTKGFVDRDGKLVKEFQTSFNSVFWELYLFSVFKKFGFVIDFSYKYPDFVVEAPYKLSIEAVTANNADNHIEEWNRDISKDLPNIDEIIRTATIRLANSIISKYRKFKNLYSQNEVQKNRPFILAVAPFEQPYFWEQTQRAIIQVLYAQKGFRYKNDEKKNTREILGVEYCHFITKDNGSEIPLGFFSDNQMPEISAVIFSNIATLGKIRALTKEKDPRKMVFSFVKYNRNGLHPHQGVVKKELYHEELEDGLTIFLNPYANKPLDQGFIDLFPGFHAYDINLKCAFGEAKDENVMNRSVSIFTMDENRVTEKEL